MLSEKNLVNIENLDFTNEQRFINRELSWLSFNERVLEEAKNTRYPILERLRFLSISGNNLDEFHMVRIAGLTKQVRERLKTKSADGRTPEEQLKDVTYSLKKLIDKQQVMWGELKKNLSKEKIKIINSQNDFRKHKKEIFSIFDKEILPTLTPMTIDPTLPFPFLSNLSSTLVLSLSEKKNKFNAMVMFPENLQRFYRVYKDKDIFIKTEDIILLNVQKLFPNFKLLDSAFIRIIRDSDIEFEEEAEDLMGSFEVALKKRRLGSVIGLYVMENIGQRLLKFIKKELGVSNIGLFKVKSELNIESLNQIISLSNNNLLFKRFVPRFPKRIKNYKGDCFAAIKNKDLMIHHPFESFDVVVQFLTQASSDPHVISIKQTLYRTSANSPIIEALIEASNNGKSVTAIVELKARFDEERNIKWARDLMQAGVNIVYGFVNWKTHAKISMVTRRERGKIVTYTHFGTGNYHPVTAKIYTDLSLFSCNKELGIDAGKIFNFITGNANPENMNLIFFSPINMREKLIELINQEIKNKKRNLPSGIWIKINSLIDPDIIDALYRASICGVTIKLIVRGICGLRPGIKGLSENISVKSVIGRFLEHSRIYCFANGKQMPSKGVKVFISSADLMTRNLDRRVEALIPIKDQTLHQQILERIMVSYMKDNLQSSELLSDGTYKKLVSKNDMFSAHDFFMNNPSLSS